MPYMLTLLQPLAALIAWSGVMLLWLYVTRFSAMKAKGISLKGRVGSRGGDLEGAIDPKAQWKAHNYNHLMEQPTLFYATIVALVLMGDASTISMVLAWAYVGFRVAHSLEQSLTNRVAVRFPLFAMGSLCLLGLIGKLVFAVFFASFE